jgi:hypothetical protein
LKIDIARLRYPSCGFEADRDVVGKLNIIKRALKMLRIKIDFGGVLAPLTAPQMTDVNPNRWGEPMNRLQEGWAPSPFKAERRSVASLIRFIFRHQILAARSNLVKILSLGLRFRLYPFSW